jgi:hypothetical protein
MAAFGHHGFKRVFPRDMKKTFIYRPTTARWASGFCHAQPQGLDVMDRALSGRTTE